MELMEIMSKRYSCRRFSDEAVKDEDLQSVLEAGHIAPSAINRQPWRFLVMKSSEGLANVDACSKCRYNAPVAILVCFDKDESAKNPDVTPDYGWIDCGLAMMQMALEAENLGLGTCIVGAYDPAIAVDRFNIPDNMVPYQFLMLGHPAEGPSPRHNERRPLSEIVVEESF